MEQSLEDFLATVGQPEGFDYNNAFAINNDDEALWAMRRLAQAQRRIDVVKAQAQVELDRINAWIEQNTVANGQTVEYFERILGDYLMRVRENDADGRKSLDFPDGKVTSRVVSPKVEVTDLELFLSWAEHHSKDEWVRVKREANLAVIKQGVDYADGAVLDPTTGVAVDGLAPVEGGISTSVKVSE
jgi:phage host-nuclease inhibitor protein Gam